MAFETSYWTDSANNRSNCFTQTDSEKFYDTNLENPTLSSKFADFRKNHSTILKVIIVTAILVILALVAVGVVYGVGRDNFVNWAQNSALPWMQQNATYLEIGATAIGSCILGMILYNAYNACRKGKSEPKEEFESVDEDDFVTIGYN